MANTIPPKTIEEIERLLATTTKSQREIAQITNVSRGIISLIATGKRKPHSPKPKPKNTNYPTGPTTRCPTCGHLTTTPCHICHIRKLKTTTKPTYKPPTNPKDADLQLELDDKARYERIRHQHITRLQHDDNWSEPDDNWPSPEDNPEPTDQDLQE